MENKQKAAYEQIMEIAQKIKEGFYGQNNEFDVNTFYDDLYLLEKLNLQRNNN